MNRLPPFDSLVAFDAALRLGSMTLAATELGVTQSAVSHRIRRLESFMETPLLYRHNTGLTPTAAGEALLEGLAGLLSGMANLRALCRTAAGPDRLRVGVGAALAQTWLPRRLSRFTAEHPDISIELAVVDSEAPEQVADLDVRLHWEPAAGLRATSLQRPLFQEHVFPVCHPSLLPSGFQPADVAVLLDLPLLHKGPAGRATAAEWSWSAWFERLNLPPRPRENLRFASIGPAINAALEGAGVALGRTLLVHDAIAEGRLVRLLPPRYDLPSSRIYVIRWASPRQADPRIGRFVDWLSGQADETRREEEIAERQAQGLVPAETSREGF